MNTIRVNDTLYFFKFEVSNKLYNTFLNDIRRDTIKYDLSKVDTNKWNTEYSAESHYSKYYHSNPAFENCPVVNISYDGAILFCAWLTDKFKKIKLFKKAIKEARLPFSFEWDYAAQGGSPSAIFSWADTSLITRDSFPYCLYSEASNLLSLKFQDPNTKISSIDFDITVPNDVNYYFRPNNFGLYNMCGNVAEMLLEKGRTKGGSWGSDKKEFLMIDGVDEYAGYTEPSPYIGFRFVVILKKKIK